MKTNIKHALISIKHIIKHISFFRKLKLTIDFIHIVESDRPYLCRKVKDKKLLIQISKKHKI